MYRKISDFFREFDEVVNSTSKIFAALTDESLNQAVAEGHRKLGGIAWHIVVTIPEMMKQTGLTLSADYENTPPPASAKEIRDAYQKVTTDMRRALKKEWTDDTLLQTDNLYGEEWERGRTLHILLHHEVHHRGQMTVLMRQAGLKVPGAFGPSKEEWSAYGAEPPAY